MPPRVGVVLVPCGAWAMGLLLGAGLFSGTSGEAAQPQSRSNPVMVLTV